MPLKVGKSPKVFEHNLKAEMHAGKPQAQALAIAYAKKREAEKRKKMWRGGDVDSEGGPNPDEVFMHEHYNSSGEPHTNANKTDEHPMTRDGFGEPEGHHPLKYAKGGRVGEEQKGVTPMHEGEEDFVGKVVKKYAQGGRVGESNYSVDHGDEFEEDLDHQFKEDGPQGKGNYPRGSYGYEPNFKADALADGPQGGGNYPRGDIKFQNDEGLRKKYAHGGMVDHEEGNYDVPEPHDEMEEIQQGNHEVDPRLSHGGMVKKYSMGGYAEGGEAEDKPDPKSDPYSTFIEYAKHQPYKKPLEPQKKMAKGGMVGEFAKHLKKRARGY